MLPPEVTRYLGDLVVRLKRSVGSDLVGVWLFGSAALGDFDIRRSDLDVQAVTEDRLPRAGLRGLARTLSHQAMPCPARRLEFVLYSRAGLDHEAGAAPQLNLNTGGDVSRTDYEIDDAERFWFVTDIAIGREHGIPLFGPAASSVFPAPSPALIGTALLRSLIWLRQHEPASPGTVLAACRAWAWASDGEWRSKTDAARWAQTRLDDPTPIDRALALRSGQAAAPLAPAQVDEIIDLARARLSGTA
ncbi:MAG TPA: aminoglycoside adenylyltransferase domain-containing protein [Baekduia sp.]|nr:aminoglycoside adenylyltransferase domain-containing protein [Baekduia sp.]